MIPPYLTVLRIKGLREKFFLNVETNDPRQAATVASEHWLHKNFDLTSGASIQVHRYHPDGQVDPDVLFRLGRRALEGKQQEAVRRRNELRKWRDSFETSRRGAIERMEHHLASAQMARAELDALRRRFEAAHHRYPGLQAFLSLDGPPSLRGAGTLQFREMANHAAWLVSRSQGDDIWKAWLEIVVGYLLQKDDRKQFIAKRETVSRTADSEMKLSEAYSVSHLFEASELCCSWLMSRVPTGSAERGKVHRQAVRRNSRYEAIDTALRRIAEARPKNHEDVFRALEGRSHLPNAELFNSAGGWLAGFRKDKVAARAWLSKRWSRLGLPAFLRGPKK